MSTSSAHHPFCHLSHPPSSQHPAAEEEEALSLSQLSPEAFRAIEAIQYITQHLKQDDEYKKIRDDWKYVSMVIDRLLLYVFFGVTAGGTFGILLSAPNVFEYVDQKTVIDQIRASQASKLTNNTRPRLLTIVSTNYFSFYSYR